MFRPELLALYGVGASGNRGSFLFGTKQSPVALPAFDKVMLSLTGFADELEREKVWQRTRDALVRKARAGHVAGGRVFG